MSKLPTISGLSNYGTWKPLGKMFCDHIPSIHLFMLHGALVGVVGSFNLAKLELEKEFINVPKQPFGLYIYIAKMLC